MSDNDKNKLSIAKTEPNKIQEYSKTEIALAELRLKYEVAVFDVSNTKGMVEARKARAELRDLRVGLEKERVRIKAPALERCRLIDTEAHRITEELFKLEQPIDYTIKAEEERKEKEKQVKIEAENKRIAEIQAKINRYRNITLSLTGKNSGEIETISLSIRDEIIDPKEYQELTHLALQTREDAVTAINALHAATVAQEEEQARLKAEREELDQLRKEEEKREKEAEKKRIAEHKKEEEKRIKAEAKLKEKREAEEAKLKAEREAREAKMKEAEAKIKAEQKEHEKKMRAEREEIEKKKKQAAENQAEIERKQIEIAKKEREQEEQARLMSERRKMLAEARRDSPIAALQDILEIAEDIAGHPDHQVARFQIALIAEASLPMEVAQMPEDAVLMEAGEVRG